MIHGFGNIHRDGPHVPEISCMGSRSAKDKLVEDDASVQNDERDLMILSQPKLYCLR